MNKRIGALFLFPFALICSLFLSFMVTDIVSAATGTWIDSSTLKIGSTEYKGPTVMPLEGSLVEVSVFKATSGPSVAYFAQGSSGKTGYWNVFTTAVSSEVLTMNTTRPAPGAPPATGGTGGTGGTSDGSTTPQAKCEIDGVGWIVCPIANFLAKVTDGAYDYAKELLYFEVKNPFETSADKNPIYALWATVRNLANIVFALAFFAVIFSQATSMGISAYGIRKMLPRIIIAAILVNLSYYICIFAIDISNIIGSGLQSFIESMPDATAPTIKEGNTWESLASNVLVTGGALAIGAVMVYVAAGTVFAFLAFSILAIITALAIFMARHVLLIMLIILSPLAFVAYILPNTENLYDKWQKAFIAMLVMFPLVTILFAGTKVASDIMRSTADQVGGELTWLYKLFSLAVLAIPLFGVPWIVKFSGGFIGRVAGMVNDRNKGFIDRARKAGDKGSAVRRAELGSGLQAGARKLGTKAGLDRANAWGYDETGKKKRFLGRTRRGIGGLVSAPTRAGFGEAEREARKAAVADRLAIARSDALADTKTVTLKDQDGNPLKDKDGNVRTTEVPTGVAVAMSARSSGVEGAKGAARVRARAMATVDKVDTQNVQDEKTLFYNTHVDPTNRTEIVAGKLMDAIRQEDSVKARAMQEILLKETGSKGIDTLEAVYEEIARDRVLKASFDNKVGASMRSSMLSNGVKSKSTALDMVGLTGETVLEAREKPGTHTRLTLNEQLTQTDASFKDSVRVTNMSAQQAQAILDNPDVQNLLNTEKRKTLQEVVQGKRPEPTKRSISAANSSTPVSVPFPAAATPITYTSALRGYDASDVGRMSNQEIKTVMSNVPIQKIPSEELETLKVATSTGSSVNVDAERRSYNAAVTEELRKRTEQVSAEASYTSNIDAARQAAQAREAAERAAEAATNNSGNNNSPRP